MLNDMKEGIPHDGMLVSNNDGDRACSMAGGRQDISIYAIFVQVKSLRDRYIGCHRVKFYQLFGQGPADEGQGL
jgi:hypothetical protein